MGVPALKTGKNPGEQVGAHHRRNADFNGSLLQLLVVVDFEYGILYIAQGKFYAVQKDGTFRRQGKLLLTAVKKLDAKFCLQFFDGYCDVRL